MTQPGAGRGAALQGFKTGILGGHLTRGDIEDWLAEQHSKEEQRQRSILFWARLAGVVAIIGVVATIGTAIGDGARTVQDHRTTGSPTPTKMT